MKIAVAIGVKPHNKEVLHKVLDLFGTDEHEVTVLHVQRTASDNETKIVEEILGDEEGMLGERLHVEYLQTPDPTDKDAVGRAVVEFCSENEFDILVMGRTHKSLVDKFMLGSSSSTAIDEGEIPVLIVPA